MLRRRSPDLHLGRNGRGGRRHISIWSARIKRARLFFPRSSLSRSRIVSRTQVQEANLLKPGRCPLSQSESEERLASSSPAVAECSRELGDKSQESESS